MTALPAINQQFSADFSSYAQVTAANIRANYNDLFNQAAQAFGLDPNLTIAFSIVEDDTTNPGATSPAGAIGLLQLQPATAYDTIKAQAPGLAAMPAYKAIIDNYMPGFLKPLGLVGFSAFWSDQIAASLAQPDFNIWTGTARIAQLCKKAMSLDGGILRLDHVIIMYNMGVTNYYKYVIDAGLADADLPTLVSQLGVPETTAYLVKMLGIDGACLAAIRSASN